MTQTPSPIPTALLTKLAAWCAERRNGQIILNVADGHVRSYQLSEYGKVADLFSGGSDRDLDLDRQPASPPPSP